MKSKYLGTILLILIGCSKGPSAQENNIVYTPYEEPYQNDIFDINGEITNNPVLKKISDLQLAYPSCGDSTSYNGIKLKNRLGYYMGSLYAFARLVCRENSILKQGATIGSVNMYRDALTIFDNIKLYAPLTESNEKHLMSTLTILLSHGLVESGGDFREGIDTQNSTSYESQNTESGLYQSSYSVRYSLSAKAKMSLANLEQEYSTNMAKCQVRLFKMGLPSKTPNPYVGTGEGLAFQKLLRTCPMLAVEHGAITIRHNLQHYGPLINRQSSPFKTCEPLIEDFYQYLSTNKNTVCSSVLQN